MAKDLYIQDTCEVFITSLKTGNVVGVGYAQISALDITVESTPIRGGISNKLAYTIKSSKDLALNITSATMKPEFLSIIQGGEWKETDVNDEVRRTFVAKVVDNAGALEIAIPDDIQKLNLSTFRVEDTDGTQQDIGVALGDTVITVPVGYLAKDGDEVEVFYLKPVKGKKFEIDTRKFGEKYRIDYNTLCYDRETETPYSELSFVFNQASSDGNVSMSFQNGEAWIPEMNFAVTAPKGSNVLGTKYEELITP